jgi:hypothetical protein
VSGNRENNVEYQKEGEHQRKLHEIVLKRRIILETDDAVCKLRLILLVPA